MMENNLQHEKNKIFKILGYLGKGGKNKKESSNSCEGKRDIYEKLRPVWFQNL